VESVSRARRASAIVALVAAVAVLAVAVASLVQRPLVLLVAIACLGVAIAAASYALTRTGARRLLAAVERRIDLGLVDDRVFVNNATVGLYAKIVQSPAYRDRKVDTALELLPGMLGPDAAPFDLRFVGPDGTEYHSAHLILVSNNRYELGHAEGFGSRRRLDAGTLGIVAARLQSPGEAARFTRLQASGPTRRPADWAEWTDITFELRSGQPVEIGIDGEAMLLDPPIRFRILPRALRVRIPPHAPGYSPAAAVPTPGWATLTALWQTATGRPVTTEP
jgi:diacylglycerol kinase family enzyme